MINLKNIDLDEFDTLLFDLDGTLIDSKKSNYLAYKSALAELNRVLIESEFDNYWGKDVSEFLPSIFNNLTPDEITFIKNSKPEFFKLYLNEITLNEDLIQLLIKKSNTHKTGLVTTAKLNSVNLILKEFNLTKYFSVIVTGDDAIKPKPSAEPYLYALQKLGSLPNKTLVFEDSETGIISAKSAGIKVITIDFNLN